MRMDRAATNREQYAEAEARDPLEHIMRFLKRHSPEVRRLSLSGDFAIHHAPLLMTGLRHLALHHVIEAETTVAAALTYLPHLTSLHLSVRTTQHTDAAARVTTHTSANLKDRGVAGHGRDGRDAGYAARVAHQPVGGDVNFLLWRPLQAAPAVAHVAATALVPDPARSAIRSAPTAASGPGYAYTTSPASVRERQHSLTHSSCPLQSSTEVGTSRATCWTSSLEACAH
jgi:hypothetical protein